jgi:uncharacterized protein (TIGR02453 family)
MTVKKTLGPRQRGPVATLQNGPVSTRRRGGVDPGFEFSAATFAYFDAARRKAHNEAWFAANRARWEASVEVPFTHLILELKRELAPLLAGFAFSPRRLSRPVRRANPKREARVRANAYAALAEPSESMFDMNPGFYIDIGAERSLIACGLYEVSSRQMRALRPALVEHADEVRALLADRTLRRYWKQEQGGVLAGSRYTRFPKAFDESGPGAEFLWHRQWMLSRSLTREEVCSPKFVAQTVAAFKAALPWLAWTRRTVGVWKRPAAAREREWL